MVLKRWIVGLDDKNGTSRSLTFSVAGRPVTQGSKQARAANGRAWVVDVNPKGLTAWRHAVNDEARRALGGESMLTPPVHLEALFAIQPPQGLPKRRRTWPVGARSGDADKLGRAVLDAVTGVLVADDAHVTRLVVEKDWAAPGMSPGVVVTVREVGA